MSRGLTGGSARSLVYLKRARCAPGAVLSNGMKGRTTARRCAGRCFRLPRVRLVMRCFSAVAGNPAEETGSPNLNLKSNDNIFAENMTKKLLLLFIIIMIIYNNLAEAIKEIKSGSKVQVEADSNRCRLPVRSRVGWVPVQQPNHF